MGAEILVISHRDRAGGADGKSRTMKSLMTVLQSPDIVRVSEQLNFETFVEPLGDRAPRGKIKTPRTSRDSPERRPVPFTRGGSVKSATSGVGRSTCSCGGAVGQRRDSPGAVEKLAALGK